MPGTRARTESGARLRSAPTSAMRFSIFALRRTSLSDSLRALSTTSETETTLASSE